MATAARALPASGHVIRQERAAAPEGHQARKVAMFRSLPSVVVATAAFLTLGVVAPVHAQEFMAANAADTVLFPVTPLAPAPVARAADEGATAAKAEVEQGPTFVRAGFTPRVKRPLALPALYAAQAALQALDAHSTYAAINRGGVEANPLMKGVVGNKGAMMAVKAGVAASTIWVAERMWKKGNRAGAIATMLVVNGITAAVVANNYKVASTLR
jgi:Domain of unknown function (DUF5658)